MTPCKNFQSCQIAQISASTRWTSLKRPAYLVKQFNLLEIVAVLLLPLLLLFAVDLEVETSRTPLL